MDHSLSLPVPELRGIRCNYNEKNYSKQTERGGISRNVSLHSGIGCHRMLGKLKTYTGSGQDQACSQKTISMDYY